MEIKAIVTELRKNQTPAERMLWEYLRNRKMKGKRFIRQFPIIFYENNRKKFFVADFYCSEAKLVVELDGSVHKNRRECDQARTDLLSQLGLRVLRFTNDDVFNHFNSVIKKLESFLYPNFKLSPSLG